MPFAEATTQGRAACERRTNGAGKPAAWAGPAAAAERAPTIGTAAAPLFTKSRRENGSVTGAAPGWLDLREKLSPPARLRKARRTGRRGRACSGRPRCGPPSSGPARSTTKNGNRAQRRNEAPSGVRAASATLGLAARPSATGLGGVRDEARPRQQVHAAEDVAVARRPRRSAGGTASAAAGPAIIRRTRAPGRLDRGACATDARPRPRRRTSPRRRPWRAASAQRAGRPGPGVAAPPAPRRPPDAGAQREPDPRVHDEQRVAVEPAVAERHQPAHAVGVEEVEERVRGHAEEREPEQRPRPDRLGVGVAPPAHPAVPRQRRRR